MASSEKDTFKVWQPLALSLMLALGMMFGYKMNDSDQGSLISFASSESSSSGVGQVEELIRFIENRYVDSVGREDLVEKAMNSILDELDPHSVYISPSQLDDVNDEMNGRFKGIGVEIFYIEDTVNIIRVIPDGPADRAGVKPFDKLISINDSLVAGQKLKFADIRKMLRGDVGNELEIKLLNRQNQDKSASILIDDIPVSSVKGGVMIDDKTGYIKIDRFGSNTYREFMDYFQELTEKEKMQNIIIDLRGNPGGFLPQATNILCQLFKEKGQLLVYTQGKNDRKFEYKSTGKTFFNIEKISVLIDENSASGSEIIAGAIQDWDRGVIIGRRSFGKGLVQEQYNLSNEGALRLTVARYYTPSGRSIQRTYDDMDSYYTDYEERYYKGEFFSEDSIDRGDARVYKTMELERPVYGGGGITPDIFIPIDSIKFEPFYGEIMSSIPQFVFKEISTNNFEFKKDDIVGLKKQLSSKFVNNQEKTSDGVVSLMQIKNDIDDAIGSSLIKYMQGQKDVFRHDLPRDEFIKSSLEYFYSEDKLTDLLDIRASGN